MYRFFCGAACLVLALAACSQEVAVSAKGTAGATNDIAGADVSLTDAPADAAADSADVAAVDTAPADAAVADADALPAWLSGTWRECSGTLVFDKNGAFTWSSAWQACTATGTAVLHDGLVDLAVEATSSTCTAAPPAWLREDLQVTATSGELTLVHTALFQGLKRLTRGGVRERWEFAGSKNGSGVMHLCFDAAGTFYDGRWLSQNCDMLACGANVSQVLAVGTETHLWTQCVGGCPCTAILIAKHKTDAAMDGTYGSAGCNAVEEATFTANKVKFPGDP